MAEIRVRWLTFYADHVEPASREIFSHVEKLIVGTLIVSAGAPPAAAAPAGAAAATAPAAIVLRPMRPREELLVLRSACGADVRSICGGVQPGGGRIVQCLAINAAQLSPACKDVLSQFAAR